MTDLNVWNRPLTSDEVVRYSNECDDTLYPNDRPLNWSAAASALNSTEGIQVSMH
jgi:hypothetical protein